MLGVGSPVASGVTSCAVGDNCCAGGGSLHSRHGLLHGQLRHILGVFNVGGSTPPRGRLPRCPPGASSPQHRPRGRSAPSQPLCTGACHHTPVLSPDFQMPALAHRGGPHTERLPWGSALAGTPPSCHQLPPPLGQVQTVASPPRPLLSTPLNSAAPGSGLGAPLKPALPRTPGRYPHPRCPQQNLAACFLSLSAPRCSSPRAKPLCSQAQHRETWGRGAQAPVPFPHLCPRGAHLHR